MYTNAGCRQPTVVTRLGKARDKVESRPLQGALRRASGFLPKYNCTHILTSYTLPHDTAHVFAHPTFYHGISYTYSHTLHLST